MCITVRMSHQRALTHGLPRNRLRSIPPRVLDNALIQVNGTFTPEPQAGTSKGVLNKAIEVFNEEKDHHDQSLCTGSLHASCVARMKREATDLEHMWHLVLGGPPVLTEEYGPFHGYGRTDGKDKPIDDGRTYALEEAAEGSAAVGGGE